MIERSIEVAASVETAFRAFTDHIGSWWPPDHVPGGGQLVAVRFSHAGPGADLLMETRDDGIFPIGRVTAWSPPHALTYDFFIGSSPESPSVVDVRFTPTAAGTRVDVEHRRGLVTEERWASSASGYARAWDDLMPAFAEFTQEAS